MKNKSGTVHSILSPWLFRKKKYFWSSWINSCSELSKAVHFDFWIQPVLIEATLSWCFPLVKVECVAEVDLEQERLRMTVKYSTWQLSEVTSESNDADAPNEAEGFSTAPSLVTSTKRLFLILSNRLLNWSLIHCHCVLGLLPLKIMTYLHQKKTHKKEQHWL